MPQSQLPHSLLDAWLAYEAHVRLTMPTKKADATVAQVRTALWRYTLPGWEFPLPKGQRLSKGEYEQGLDFLKQLPFQRLQEAPAVQERLFEQLAVAGNSRRNYRWALKQFMDWCNQQYWYEVETEAEGNVQRPVSRKRQPKGSANDVRLTTRRARQAYRLAKDEIPEALQRELERFSQFLMGTGPNGETTRRASLRTANQYVNQVLRFLGWLHTHQAVPLAELSLQRLVAVGSGAEGSARSNGRPQEKAEQVVELIQAYFQWLGASGQGTLDERTEAIKSPYTELKVINTWLAVARFLNEQNHISEGKEAKTARVMIAALKKLRRGVSTKLKVHQPVSDASKKRLEWHEFLDLVEILRGECRPRLWQQTQSRHGGSTLGSPRSLTAIAQSYQRFLLTALLAYIPPQRSQVLRNLLIARTLIPEQDCSSQAVSGEESVLYRDHDGWWIKIVEPRMQRQSPPYLVFVHNLNYADGRCFYQYLEEWILHYVYEDAQGNTIEVPGLRRCLNPQHLRLFTMKNGQPYQDSPTFIKLLRHPAYRFTGKAIDFHTVRQMYAKYLLSKEHSGFKSNDPFGASEGEAAPRTGTPNPQKEPEYNPADWQKAANIAQAFLDQMIQGTTV